MTSAENSITLRGLPASDHEGTEANDIEQNAVNESSADLTQFESKRTRLLVLVGSSILQLPIWGMAAPLPQ